ncbi:condensation domain-containing protein [Gloeocapsa sp. PCC 73106]|uniref:condensation domain-containing protein n=1 Tax=Gloeocapsa sp. PCC 73106 TaxID=102232 RepID=UPI0002AD0DAD|nr:condensation domain-containing protein [Gloeocapsa sp. PCC 73106]ELR96360.1 non-ribosomal peptide synthase [Gloeocapsa sp. PCC 73106]
MKNSESLSLEQKRILLAEMLAQKSSVQSFPLSFGQERIWLHSQINPNDPLYNVTAAYEIHGKFSEEVLKSSLKIITKRHDSLRTKFSLVNNQPVQVVELDISCPLEIIDSSQERGDQLLAEAIKKPFNLNDCPLWCVKIVRYSPEHYVLLIVMNHIIGDGWSFYLFVEELKKLYEAKNASLPDLPNRYSDFAQKQRNCLTGETAARQMSYWKENLAGTVSTLKLPVNKLQTSIPSYQGKHEFLELSENVSQALRELSKKQGATLFMTLLAAFKTLMYIYSQQQDLLICFPVSGRHHPQSKDLIGYCNNILPIRSNLSGDLSFLELLTQVRQTALNAYKNQDIPFQSLSNLPNLRQTSLTKALFSVDMRWPPQLSLNQLEIESLYLHTGRVNFDISLSIWEELNHLKGVLEYKTDLFDHQVIEQLINDYRNLLETIVIDPQQKLSALGSCCQPAQKLSKISEDSKKAKYVAPRTPVEFQVTQIWEQVLGISPIGVQDNLFLLGASSLAAATIGQRIKETFAQELSVAAIFQAPTIEKTAELLLNNNLSLANSCLTPIQPNGNKPPLFLCEGVGIYSGLIPYLGDNQPIFGLIRDKNHQLFQIEKIAERYISTITEVQAKGPYYLGGISLGGLVAFEMAQQLVSQGEEVALLLLIDTPGPDPYSLKPFHLRLVGHLQNLWDFGFSYIPNKILKTRNKQLSKLARLLGLKVVERSSYRLEAVKSAKKYRFCPYDGSITLFALKDRSAMTDSLFDPKLGNVDPLLGWGKVAKGGVDAYYFLGEHISLLKEPYVEAVAEQLKDCLNRVQAKWPVKI